MDKNLSASDPSRLTHFLRELAPFSIIDHGRQLMEDGKVSECSRVANSISGIVEDNDETQYQCRVEVLGQSSVKGHCGCSTDEEMNEQWCAHAIALLTRAFELEFFKVNSGFAAQESAIRMNNSSPRDIANVIRELASDTLSTPSAEHYPKVSVKLACKGDRLGVQVLFDKEVQEPLIFESVGSRSSRTLDNMLVGHLDDRGSWDENARLWHLASSEDIALFFGVLSEYKEILAFEDGQALHLNKDPLDAQLRITWRHGAAELSMLWLLPGEEPQHKTEELIGTGPYWVRIGRILYRLSRSAMRIASIFPYGGSVTLTRSQLGPVLETLLSLDAPNLSAQCPFVIMKNEKAQPACEVRDPIPTLEVSKRESHTEHFSSQDVLELSANLDFVYPQAPQEENIVYLPNRELEQEYIKHLHGLGFHYESERRAYFVRGDDALDVLHKGQESFPEPWKVDGLTSILKGVRFAKLTLDISVQSTAKQGSGRKKADAASAKIDWFDCQIALTQNRAHIPLSVLFKRAQNDGARWIRLDNGAFAKIPGGGLGQLRSTLGLLSPNYRLANTIKTQLSTAQAIGFCRMDDDHISVRADKTVQALAHKLRHFEAIEPIKPNRKFQGKLRNYQNEGISWMNFLHEFGLGGILADEMGLGKTVQTLAYLQFLVAATKAKKKTWRPVLVIAPTSVVTNWQHEAVKFTPDLKTTIFHGSKRKSLLSELSEYDLVITSYALLRIDRGDLAQVHWSYLILDEAQNIKNPAAATTKAAKALVADNRLVLTGTPTENRPLELWSLFDFLMPGYLGSIEFFRNTLEKPILEQGVSEETTQFLNARTKPFILRREKAQVERDLPDKVESEMYVAMAPSQRALYQEVLNEVRPRVMQAVADKGVRGATISILAALLRLRQICNHPNSIDSLTEVEGYESGKFQLFQELVTEALENKHKILVFCQFREMLAIMRRWLAELGIVHLYLDGATKNRQDLIDEFNGNDGIRLFLISLKAGGTGLNLTAADTVVIYDPWWNPAVESQAVDRAHRIGQTKNVNVYRLVTEGSIEEKIMSLKTKKDKIVQALIKENSVSPLSLSKMELENLFEI